MSSAYNLNLVDLMILGKSFINIKNASGPNILPCGTPYLIGKLLENIPFASVR